MNTFTLKMTALILMVLDHIGCYFDGAPVWLNWLGRLSYPLFLFCMVQGYRHTRSRKRYLLRLYLMSLFMTGFSYFLDSRFPTPNGYGNHNIFLPMLLTGVLISTIEWFGREDSFPVRAAMRTAHGINAARCPLPVGCPPVCTSKLVHPCGRPPGLLRKKIPPGSAFNSFPVSILIPAGCERNHEIDYS